MAANLGGGMGRKRKKEKLPTNKHMYTLTSPSITHVATKVHVILRWYVCYQGCMIIEN